MMNVSHRQMELLARPFREAEIDCVVRHLRQHYAERVARLDDLTLRQHLTEPLQRARQWGLSGSQSLAAFISLCLTVSARFDSHPKVRALLEGDTGTPQSRLESLGTELSDADWLAIRGQATPA